LGRIIRSHERSFRSFHGANSFQGQCCVGLDPAKAGAYPHADWGVFGGDEFPDRLEALFSQMLVEPGTRLPGQKRLAARERTAAAGVSMPAALHARLKALSEAVR